MNFNGLTPEKLFGGVMCLTRSTVGMALAGTLALGGMVFAQSFPSKTIRIVTSAAGGGSDLASRLIAQGLAGPLGQPVIVDNRGGTIPIEIVLKAPPDGHTVLLSASMWVAPLFQPDLPWDPLRDFAPVALAVSTPNILVTHPSLPVKSVKALIALAKARPGELNYATGSTGSSSHVAAELFRGMAGIKMMRVPYKNAGPGIIAVMGGEVHMMFATAGSVTPYIKSGRLRALAVTSLKPSALSPDLPTVAASGLPGYEANTLFALFAPAKTPPAIINRLNQEVVRLLNRPDVKDKILSSGVEATPSSPEQLEVIIKSEIATLGRIVKEAGLRAE